MKVKETGNPDPPRMERNIHPVLKWGCLVPILVVLVLFLLAHILDRVVPSAVRRALPKSATDVQEYYSDTWNGDYVRCIRARLPEGDMPLYAKNLGLARRFDPVKDAQIASSVNMGFSGPIWWTPPYASHTTWFRYEPDRDYLEVLNYSDGYVYLLSTSW